MLIFNQARSGLLGILICLFVVEVDDGETGEVPIASVRAKMIIHDKEAGWKERGAGMLKINVPHSAIEFDESGLPVQGSFDAAAMDEEDEEYDDDGSLIPTEPKVPRLLMRQDQTHRILLNTAILPEMNFQEKASLKSVGVLFTAFEGQDARPISVTMRVSSFYIYNLISIAILRNWLCRISSHILIGSVRRSL